MKTTANATVDHLSKYLALRVALEDGHADGDPEDRGRDEGGGSEGTPGSGGGSSLGHVSEKQYTIYILTRGGQFSVSPFILKLEKLSQAGGILWNLKK